MKIFFTPFLTLLIFFTIGDLKSQNKDWTLLVYVVGSDIVNDAITDLGEMKAAGNTDNVNIVVLRGGAQLEGWETPNSLTLENGTEVPQTFLPTANHMADAVNITEFIDWGTANFPADKYMLLFYNHGMDIRGFGWDNTVNKSLKVWDIQSGIGESEFIANGNKFEIIGFDACLMGCFEVQSALRDFGNYYIGSEETEPWHAWNWTPVITAMNDQAGLTAPELGEIIIDNYIQHSIDNETEHVTLGMVELSKITALETSLETLLGSLNDDIYLSNFIKARADAEEYHKVISTPEYSEDMVDIGDLVKHLKKLEPGLTSQVDNVLAKIDDAVVYERSDATRPKATGISMYVPMNVFVDEPEAVGIVEQEYLPIDFSSTVKNFIAQDYLDFAFSDDSPVSGSFDDGWGFAPGGGLVLGPMWSALKIDPEHEDLHQIQVILLEEITDVPDEYFVLGSSYPDTSAVNLDGSTTYAYEWDEEWLSLNGFPAYIADIQYFEVDDEQGNFDYGFTRIHMPALLNPNTNDEKEIMMSFVYDENFNHELEGILREPYGDEVMVPSKERIDLQPGDQVQLLYEVFDAETNEAFFVVDEDAVIQIENGNDDLILDHTHLSPGKYHLGFVLMDHSHNDTLIYDPLVREVMASSTNDLAGKRFEVTISPNPVTDVAWVSFEEGLLAEEIQVFNSLGEVVLTKKIKGQARTNIDLKDLARGTYFLHVLTGGRTFSEKIIKH